MFLHIVGLFHRIQDPGGNAVFHGGTAQGLHILGETGATIAASCIQKMIANAGVGADALAHLFDVGAKFFRQHRQLVHERDARRQHGIGSILGELRRADIHDDQSLAIALERGIQCAQQLGGLFVVGAHNDPVGLHEIIHRRAFLEELGI
jgi:hypothetical protein